MTAEEADVVFRISNWLDLFRATPLADLYAVSLIRRLAGRSFDFGCRGIILASGGTLTAFAENLNQEDLYGRRCTASAAQRKTSWFVNQVLLGDDLASFRVIPNDFGLQDGTAILVGCPADRQVLDFPSESSAVKTWLESQTKVFLSPEAL